MATVRNLFLDLEDTVIAPVTEGWFNTQLINVQRVRRVIEIWKPTSVHLFSFAIWDEGQRERFNMGTRERLERALGVKLGLIPTIDNEIIPSACKVLNLSTDYVTFQDACDFWGKHEAFRLNMRHIYKNTHAHDVDTEVMFLDDDVINETFEWPDLRLKGTILNIDNLPKEWQ